MSHTPVLDTALLKAAKDKVAGLGEALFLPPDPKKPLGAFRGDRASRVSEDDAHVTGLEHNRKNNPINYWANPFVRGPISELLTRLDRRRMASQTNHPIIAGLNPVAASGLGGDEISYGAIGADIGMGIGLGGPEARKGLSERATEDSKDYDQEKRDKKKLNKKAEKLGPFSLDRAADVVGDDKRIAMLARNREENPRNYWMNPFVGGPLSELLARASRRWSATEGTSMPMSVMNRIPGPNVLSIPASMAMGGPERRQKLREDYRDTVKDDKKEKRSNALYFGQYAGRAAATQGR